MRVISVDERDCHDREESEMCSWAETLHLLHVLLQSTRGQRRRVGLIDILCAVNDRCSSGELYLQVYPDDSSRAFIADIRQPAIC